VARSELRDIDLRAPRLAVDSGIRKVAEDLAREAASRSPVGDTGNLRDGWQAEPARSIPGKYVVTNPVYYSRFVEYGTKRMRARPMIGPVLARYRARGAR
jgi:hypothetical protein